MYKRVLDLVRLGHIQHETRLVLYKFEMVGQIVCLKRW